MPAPGRRPSGALGAMRLISLLGLVALASFISAPSRSSAVGHSYQQRPLSFEPNHGQSDRRVDYLSRGPGYTLFLSSNEAALSFAAASPGARAAVLRMNLVGAHDDAAHIATDERPGKVNYFVGNDPSRWLTGISTYGKTTYRDVYPGIDVVYYGNQGQLEYDFIVRPGASARSIGLRFEGADRVDIDAGGDLVMQTGAGVIRNHRPRIYQVVDGHEYMVAGAYVRNEGAQIGFDVGSYDTTRPLVIDPVLVYSTFTGSTTKVGDRLDVRAIAVDASGNTYVTGLTAGSSDVFVRKFDASGSTLVYSTYIGGQSFDGAFAIAIDAAGNAYVTGHTSSADFPTTAGAFDTQIDTLYRDDAFVTKLNATGSALVYSTYLGGIADEAMNGYASIAVDDSGSAYVAAGTTSPDFPTTAGAFDQTYNGEEDAFVTKINPAGSSLIYSTFLGGRRLDIPEGIAIDSSGNAYISGMTGSMNFPTTAGALDVSLGGTRDAFVAKLNANGSALVYSTYVGGSAVDGAAGIALDTSGNGYIAGITSSSDFPVTGEAFDTHRHDTDPNITDAFAAKLNATGSNLVYSTYFGGKGSDTPRGIAVDRGGYAVIVGETFSTGFPLERPLDVRGGPRLFVGSLISFNRTGSAPVYSTYLGGTGHGVAVDATGNVYVAGYTSSADFPTTPGAFDTTYSGITDGFVMKVSDSAAGVRIALAPRAARAFVDARHCVTAVAEDTAGRRLGGIAVRFDVSGAITATGVATTNQDGRAEFCYPGSLRPGLEQVEAQPER
jgi:beta-propeller repeat-containing protein